MTTDDTINDASRGWWSLRPEDTVEVQTPGPVYDGNSFWAYGHTITFDRVVVSRHIGRELRHANRRSKALTQWWVRGRYTVEVAPSYPQVACSPAWEWQIYDARNSLVTEGRAGYPSRGRAKRDAFKELAILPHDGLGRAGLTRYARRSVRKGGRT